MKISILTVIVLLSCWFLPITSIAGLASSESVFISEVSFAGSVADNNCQIGPRVVTNLCSFDKWIELYNPSDNTVSLNNWQIEIQGGLVEKLSGSIASQSFLVLGNTKYRYQLREKIEETFDPKISSENVNLSTEKTSTSTNSESKSSYNSNNSLSQSSSEASNSGLTATSKSSSSTQNNTSLEASFINPGLGNFSTDLQMDNSSQKSEPPKSSFNSDSTSQSSQPLNQVTPSELVDKQDTKKLANSSRIFQSLNPDSQKPKLTLEQKSDKIQNKTLNFNKLANSDGSQSLEKLGNQGDIYLQIDRESLDQNQINFINSKFKNLFRLQNGHYEALNSQFSTNDKHELAKRKITWQLQKQTTVNLQSVLTQAGVASSPLGILHGLSPNSPQVKLKHNGIVISQRQFANSTNQSVNRYTMEFEDTNSFGTIAQDSYFPKNFGTPGFGKVKKKEKNEPIISGGGLITPNTINLNPQINPQTQAETTKQTNPEPKAATQADSILEAVTDKVNSTIKNPVTEAKTVESNSLVETLAPTPSPSLELSPVNIPQTSTAKNPLVQTQGQMVAQPNPITQKNELAQNLAPKSAQSLVDSALVAEVAAKNEVENKAYLSEQKVYTDTLKNSFSKNYLWQLYLPVNSQSLINTELIENNLASLSNIDNLNSQKFESLRNSQLPATSNVFQSIPQVKSSYLGHETTFGLSTNAFLNFWVNLLLLILAFRRKNLPTKNNLVTKANWHRYSGRFSYLRSPVYVRI